MHKLNAAACAALLAVCTVDADAGALRINPATDKPTPDLSARPRIGKASFYAKMFHGRKMADGTPMDPMGDNAASRTLPLGTKAVVTNLETGRSSVVTIRDRGPYVHGRIVDLSPATAQQLGITPRIGVAMVEVAPIIVPLRNGSVRWGQSSQVATMAREPPRLQSKSFRLTSLQVPSSMYATVRNPSAPTLWRHLIERR